MMNFEYILKIKFFSVQMVSTVAFTVLDGMRWLEMSGEYFRIILTDYVHAARRQSTLAAAPCPTRRRHVIIIQVTFM